MTMSLNSTPTLSRPGNPRQQVTIPQAKGEGFHKTYYQNRFAKKGQHVEKHQVRSKSENFRKLVKKMSLYIQFNLLGFFGGTRDSNQSQFQHYLQHSPTLLPPLPFRSISHEMAIPLTTFMIMKVSHWKNFRNKGKWVQWSMTLQWASHGLSSRVIRIETENVWILVASRDWVRTKRACFFERLKDHRLQPWISN